MYVDQLEVAVAEDHGGGGVAEVGVARPDSTHLSWQPDSHNLPPFMQGLLSALINSQQVCAW